MNSRGTSGQGGAELPTERLRTGRGPVEYRWERRSGSTTVVIFHGGHMRAGLSLGEEPYRASGCSLLIPSRPGYGKTPLSVGASPEEFADTAADLCSQLGITDVAACVGISAGGPTAVAMAARHPDLVRRVVLESAVGPLPWPGLRTAAAARLVFSPRTEAATWRLTGTLLRKSPEAGLRFLLRDLTTESPTYAFSDLGEEGRSKMVALLSAMRSGAGFANDLDQLRRVRPLRMPSVVQPALVVASPQDGSVPFAHAEALVRALPHADLVVSSAPSHFVWFGPDRARTASRIQQFVASPTDG
nr:alpha/beta hydrolase [Streptomyces sp. PTY087I2]